MPSEIDNNLVMALRLPSAARRCGHRRVLSRWAVVGAVVLAAVVVLPAPAMAHASVDSTSPPDGAVLDTAPESFSMVFNEQVTVPVAGLRVYDGAGERVDLGDVGGGAASDQASVRLQPDLPDGAYIATFRAVSADGHPIRGAFVFQVGEGAATPDQATIDGLLSAGSDAAWGWFHTVLRFVAYASGLVVVGWALVAPRLRPVTGAPKAAALACAVASLLQIPAFAAEVTGLGIGALGSGAAMLDALTSSVGQGAILRTVLVPLAARLSGTASAVVAVGVAGAELLAGHTRTVEPLALMLGADLVHVVAVAVWIGGLWVLLTGWKSGSETWRLQASQRLSSMALVSVGALTVAGAAMGWATVRSLDALTSTTYGRTLMVKVGLVALVLFVAAANRRLVATGSDPARIWSNVRLELGGIVVILAATAFLVGTQPAADAAGLLTPAAVTVEFGDGLLDVVADPGEAGLNELHMYVLDANGLPVDVSGEATVQLSLPAADIGPIEREPIVAGTGHFLLRGPEMAVPGEWQIRFELRTSAFAQTVGEATVPIR